MSVAVILFYLLIRQSCSQDLGLGLLFSLIQNGPEKKTVLARRINRNYDYFTRYLEFLELLGFVNRETSTDTEIINVSDSGKFFLYTQIFKYGEKSNLKIFVKSTCIKIAYS